MLKGLSFILGKGVSHCGGFVKGTWFDNNSLHEMPQGERTGWGIKADLAIGKVLRPIPYFWELGFWKKEKPVIQDILDAGQEFARYYFGNDLYEQIILLPPRHWIKRTVWNPWYALYWFVLRTPILVWPFISVGTPWVSFYIGCRSFGVDPFTRDRTWCGKKEERVALRDPLKNSFYALSPSVSIRRDRD